MLRIPRRLYNRLTDASLTSQPVALQPQEDSWYTFLLEDEYTPKDIAWLEGLGPFKKSNGLIGYQTRDLPVYSIVPR
jgi:hypothetical protein